MYWEHQTSFEICNINSIIFRIYPFKWLFSLMSKYIFTQPSLLNKWAHLMHLELFLGTTEVRQISGGDLWISSPIESGPLADLSSTLVIHAKCWNCYSNHLWCRTLANQITFISKPSTITTIKGNIDSIPPWIWWMLIYLHKLILC